MRRVSTVRLIINETWFSTLNGLANSRRRWCEVRFPQHIQLYDAQCLLGFISFKSKTLEFMGNYTQTVMKAATHVTEPRQW